MYSSQRFIDHSECPFVFRLLSKVIIIKNIMLFMCNEIFLLIGELYCLELLGLSLKGKVQMLTGIVLTIKMVIINSEIVLLNIEFTLDAKKTASFPNSKDQTVDRPLHHTLSRLCEAYKTSHKLFEGHIGSFIKQNFKAFCEQATYLQ
ncbi:unnamed protein product [Moneuplotes crassus]|uniref:Uncharacterized protein n=1 Tax=Euplotes crassus TaxID=5936 RepID=A0AAD1U6G8_EUPCR|nr:unnamed protein product [Moneuplotes crassus]